MSDPLDATRFDGDHMDENICQECGKEMVMMDEPYSHMACINPYCEVNK